MSTSKRRKEKELKARKRAKRTRQRLAHNTRIGRISAEWKCPHGHQWSEGCSRCVSMPNPKPKQAKSGLSGKGRGRASGALTVLQSPPEAPKPKSAAPKTSGSGGASATLST